MSNLQIIVEKSKTLTLNADLSQSMILFSSEQLLCEVCQLTPTEYNLIASKYRIPEISLFTMKSKKMATYRRRQTRRHLSDFLCLQRIDQLELSTLGRSVNYTTILENTMPLPAVIECVHTI